MSTKKLLSWLSMLLILMLGSMPNPVFAMESGQDSKSPEIPFFPGLTWESQEKTTEQIALNTSGDALSLRGNAFQAKETFEGTFPKEIYRYYSNTELAVVGWVSHNAYQDEAGTHLIFHHDSGFYLIVEFLRCEQPDYATCVRLWMSEPESNAVFVAGQAQKQDQITPNSTSFSKISPELGAVNINPTSLTLTWQAYTPTPEKYSYCIKADAPCAENDPEWTGTFLNTSVALNNLEANKIYYWQVKAFTCSLCDPKTFVSANDGTWWTFNTTFMVVNISGNAGVAGATLIYTDGNVKTVTADGSGNYALPVAYNWSGTVTPAKAGFWFSPASRSYSNVKTDQIGQNYGATSIGRLISGNAGTANALLIYFDDVTKVATADGAGNYSISVPNGWSGSITPSKAGYTFTPSSRSYTNVTADTAGQNFTAQAITYKISGNVGAAGVTLSYTDGVAKTATSASDGAYELFVSANWSGTVTPSKTGYTFSPISRTYTNVNANILSQNYTPTAITYTISGNAGVGWAVLSYTDGANKTVMADGSGNYSLTVSYNWTGNVTPSKFAYLFNPATRSYSNVLGNFAGQDYTAIDLSWLGSVSIASSESLVAVARPEIGSQFMSYNGFTQGSTTVYVPMLFKNAFGGSYKSALYIQNLDSADSNDITIKFYDANGNLTCTFNDTIASLASKGYWLPSLGCLGTSWVGAAVVTSDNNKQTAAIGRPHIGSEIMTYNGFPAGSTSVYVPMLFRDAFGGSYDSALYVQNVDSSGTANVIMKYYDTSGNPTCTQTDTIAPLASKGYWLPSISCLGPSWSGAVQITSNINIVAVARPHIGAQITTYNGFRQGSNTAYVAMMTKNITEGSNTLNSAFYIQNINPSNLADVTIKFFDTAGAETCSQSDTIAPLSSKGYWLPSIACLNASWQGSVQITSTENIVAVGRPHIGAEITTFNAASSGATTVYLPMLFKWAFGGTYNSSIYLTNASPAGTATVTLDFYDANGNLTCTQSESIPGSGTLKLQLPGSTCP
jgi:hypothetical protein